MSQVGYHVGKADIRQLDIASNSTATVTDISNIVQGVFIYEDIFTTHMTSNIEVFDGSQVRSAFPITGGEVVEMNCGERGDESRELRGKFMTFNMSAKQRNKVDIEYYVLSLITPEQLMDASISIHGNFVKPIHEIISDIVTTYYTPITGKKLVEVEECNGISAFNPTGISPAAFIKQCIREAESVENPSSIYLFYETIEGYHFVTLDKLYKAEPTHNMIYEPLHYLSEAQPGSSQILQDTITYINFDNNFNLLDGQYNIETHSFDPLTRTFRTSSYNHAEQDNRVVSNKILSTYFQAPTSRRMIVTDEHRRQSDYIVARESTAQNIYRRRQNFMDNERAQMRQYSSIRLTVSIPGNSNIIAGETANVTIPRSGDTQEDRPLNDPLLSGKYVCSAVKHQINVLSGDYATVIELIRPTYEEDPT